MHCCYAEVITKSHVDKNYYVVAQALYTSTPLCLILTMMELGLILFPHLPRTNYIYITIDLNKCYCNNSDN